MIKENKLTAKIQAVNSQNQKRKDDSLMKNETLNFKMLITHSAENDKAAERLAPPDREIIYCRFRYVSRCSGFDEIKDIQRRMYFSSAVKGKPVTAVIDLSEWIGHESEYCFSLMMKFLHDMRRRMYYIFTVGDIGSEKAAKLFKGVRAFMRGCIVEDNTLTNSEMFADYICNRYIDTEAANLLVELLDEPKMRPIRSFAAADEMCEEMLSKSPVGVIRLEDIAACLTSETSLPYVTDKAVAREYAKKARSIGSPKQASGEEEKEGFNYEA